MNNPRKNAVTQKPFFVITLPRSTLIEQALVRPQVVGDCLCPRSCNACFYRACRSSEINSSNHTDSSSLRLWNHWNLRSQVTAVLAGASEPAFLTRGNNGLSRAFLAA